MSLRVLKECPVCGDTSGKCREHLDAPDQYLCMTFADIRKGEIVSGFRCTGHTKDATWAMFALDNSQEWTQEQRDQWQREREQRKAKQAVINEKRKNEALSAIERDKQYRQILAELTLSPDDLADLKRRGFTDDEIKLCGYKSVSQYQRLQKQYSSLLPGVNTSGKGLLCGDGYLLPVRNSDGLIVGCQVRLREVSGDSGRYRWLSSATKKNPEGQSPHIHGKGFAEMPLSIIKPQEGKARGIALIEGTGIKPFLASRRLGLAVIGAAGGQWASSPNLFKVELERLSGELETKEIKIFPDAGDIGNKFVMARWQRVTDLLLEFGYSPKFAWWGQHTKIDCDIDELENYDSIEYLHSEPFFKLAENNSFDWSRDWLDFRKFTPDIKINQNDFTFPKDTPTQNSIIAVNSTLGTAKTSALIQMIKSSNRRAIIIGYRNNLLLQTIARAADEADVKIYHLQADDAGYLAADENTHMALCVDSLHHLDGYFGDTDIYIDEACSVFLHSANGGTLKERQAHAIKILNKALEVSNRVFLLDANLNDALVNFVGKLAPNKKVCRIKNTAKPYKHEFTFINSVDVDEKIKQSDRSPMLKLMLQDGVVSWISSDSMKYTEDLNFILKESGKRGYVLNSLTVSEPWAKEFLNNPNKFIEAKKPDYFIVSPSCESGVSVTLKGHFTHKFTVFFGVQSTNSQVQMLFRLRDNTIPHYVFCKERSSVRDRSTPRTYSENLLRDIQNTRALQSAFLAANNSEEVLKIMLQGMSRTDDNWLSYTNKLTVIDNREQDNLRKCLIHALKECGHSVNIVAHQVDESLRELEESAREHNINEMAGEIAKAEPYDSLETAKQVAKGNINKQIQAKITATIWLNRLPGIEDTVWGQEFIAEYILKKPDFYSQQLAYFMLNNPEISRKRSEVNWYYTATSEACFIGNIRDSNLKTWALQELNILQFLDGQQYHKDSPEVIAIMERVRSDKKLARALGITIPQETVDKRENIKFVSKLLQSIGVSFKKERKLVNGVLVWLHSIDETLLELPERKAVLEAISRNYEGYLDSDSVKKVVWDNQEQAEIKPVKKVEDHHTTSTIPTIHEVKMSNQNELEQWVSDESLKELADQLNSCESAEMLADLRLFTPADALKKASLKLDAQKKAVIKQWVIDLNDTAC